MTVAIGPASVRAAAAPPPAARRCASALRAWTATAFVFLAASLLVDDAGGLPWLAAILALASLGALPIARRIARGRSARSAVEYVVLAPLLLPALFSPFGLLVGARPGAAAWGVLAIPALLAAAAWGAAVILLTRNADALALASFRRFRGERHEPSAAPAAPDGPRRTRIRHHGRASAPPFGWAAAAVGTWLAAIALVHLAWIVRDRVSLGSLPWTTWADLAVVLAGTWLVVRLRRGELVGLTVAFVYVARSAIPTALLFLGPPAHGSLGAFDMDRFWPLHLAGFASWVIALIALWLANE